MIKVSEVSNSRKKKGKSQPRHISITRYHPSHVTKPPTTVAEPPQTSPPLPVPLLDPDRRNIALTEGFPLK